MIFNLDNASAALRQNGLSVLRCDIASNVGEIPSVNLQCAIMDSTARSENEKKLKAQKPIPIVKRILKNGDYMTVLWKDGDKTIVKRAEDEAESDYAAFTAALGIKVYGSNSALKRLVASAEVQGKKKKKTQKEKK